jgi:hypothetical protein
MHRFADQYLTQHWAEGRLAISVSSEGGWPGTFECDITALIVTIHNLANEQCPAIAELR